MTHVLIFKTNIDSEEQFLQAASVLDTTRTVLKWNIDREDIDKVLRIESTHSNTQDIMQCLVNAGFTCEELID